MNTEISCSVFGQNQMNENFFWLLDEKNHESQSPTPASATSISTVARVIQGDDPYY